jgi:hypothetical protein
MLEWHTALGYESMIEETSGLWGGEEVLANDDTV